MGKIPKLPFILFFVAGAVPTTKEIAAATKLRGRVAYRNASAVSVTEGVEPCDGVAGCVPDNYKAKYMSAEKAISLFDKRMEEAEKIAASTVGKPPVKASPTAPKDPAVTGVPKEFQNLPGGDGSVGAPNAATGAAPTGEGGEPPKPAETETPPAPAGGAAKPAWPGSVKK